MDMVEALAGMRPSFLRKVLYSNIQTRYCYTASAKSIFNSRPHDYFPTSLRCAQLQFGYNYACVEVLIRLVLVC